MADQITIYTNNILEDGTVTVSGSPDAGYPEERLWDRAIDLYWARAGSAACTIECDQGASGNVAVDFLAVGPHNLSGEGLVWEYSTTGAWAGEEVTAASWTPTDNTQQIKTTTAVTKRYWRLDLGGSPDDPRCTEVFMGLGYTFDVRVVPRAERTTMANVTWRRTIGGSERSVKFGDGRRERSYGLILDSSDLSDFRTAMADLNDYSYPFWITDDESATFLCRLIDVPVERPLSGNNNEKQILFNVVEVL